MTKDEKRVLVCGAYARLAEWIDKNVVPTSPWPEGRVFYTVTNRSGYMSTEFGLSPVDEHGMQCVELEIGTNTYRGAPPLANAVSIDCLDAMEKVVLAWPEHKKDVLRQLEFANTIITFEP